MDHAARVIQIPGFSRAAYVGHKGWVSLDATQISDWKMLAEMIVESYRLIAPKRLVKSLAADAAVAKPSKKKSAVKKAKRNKAPRRKK